VDTSGDVMVMFRNAPSGTYTYDIFSSASTRLKTDASAFNTSSQNATQSRDSSLTYERTATAGNYPVHGVFIDSSGNLKWSKYSGGTAGTWSANVGIDTATTANVGSPSIGADAGANPKLFVVYISTDGFDINYATATTPYSAWSVTKAWR